MRRKEADILTHVAPKNFIILENGAHTAPDPFDLRGFLAYLQLFWMWRKNKQKGNEPIISNNPTTNNKFMLKLLLNLFRCIFHVFDQSHFKISFLCIMARILNK